MPVAPSRLCSTPRCPHVASRLGKCTACARAFESRRQTVEPGRPWYATPRWKALRRAVLQREPLCRACRQLGHVRAATQVDHVVPHDGDALKFFDATNVQALCASCHAQKTRAETASAGGQGGRNL